MKQNQNAIAGKKKELSQFLSLITESPFIKGVFNPWADVDEIHDQNSNSHTIRKGHLKHYLESRIGKATYVIIGEAVGYQGGHFTGMAMTSERILLGHMKERGISPEHVLPNRAPKRTSRTDVRPNGFSEPTATIVWQALMNSTRKSTDFVLWNAFPWHPFDPSKGMLSNRKPSTREMTESSHILHHFMGLFPDSRIIAMGKVAAERLDKLDVPCYPVRHPARGGANTFRKQIEELIS